MPWCHDYQTLPETLATWGLGVLLRAEGKELSRS